MRFTSLQNTPIGPVYIAAEEDVAIRIGFSARPHDGVRDDDALAFARDALLRYFAGEKIDLVEVLPYRFKGTSFQETVWTELTKIPYGETISYAELARRIGQPGASRAVGMANNQNPLPILIPCHRVIGASGELVGFGGGLEVKRRLLEHEGAIAQLALPL